MPKKNKSQIEYWTDRQNEILRYLDQADLGIFAELQKLYNEQAFELQKELFDFYTKYSEDNKMTYQDVVKKLRHEDLSDYVANANRYRKQAEKDPELLRRLNAQYVSAKSTRMDALNLELVYRAGMLKGVLDSSFERHLKKSAFYAYKKAMGGQSGTINGPALEELVRTPFDGYNYSEQLWGNTDNLVKNLQKKLKQGFVRGEHPRVIARDLAKQFNVANHRAETLIRTDGTMVINNATARRYMDSGLKYYRDLVQLDDRTTQICRDIAKRDEKKLLSDMVPGVNAAPYHQNCRTTMIPDEEEINE